ncbi:DNA repair protein RecN [bacterium]|nr:DNA repair protein RecN [bacterium]PIV81389.1 MAG: hypothetical protein COW53_04605 [bacterium CG17_big_fil_post_rev_8_21_14_2_50_64_8]PJA75580.1 MAG: hypothetical protein CO151_05130 [bacterium CG_4_9_14_3_um_filter_65_15]
MLLELRIHNLAIIDDLVIPLGPGLTVLTGETGAGKSVVAGGLGLLAGRPASAEWVRQDEDLGFVEGVFDLQERPRLRRQAVRMGMSLDEDGILVVRRELRPAGRDRVVINGLVSSMAILKQLGEILLNIQSQDQQRQLARPDFARVLLDRWQGNATALAAVAEARRDFLAARSEVDAAVAQAEEGRRQVEMWRYQLEELDQAGLDAEEEMLLAEQIHFGRNARRLLESAALARELLEDGEPSARALLNRALGELDRVGGDSPRLENIVSVLRESEATLEDAARRLGQYLDTCEIDPARLDELESRKALYEDLRRKYHWETPDLIALAEELRAQLDFQDRSGEEIERLEAEVARAAKELGDAATALHARRVEGGERLAAALVKVLRPLGLPGLACRISVEISREEEGPVVVNGEPCLPAEHGCDRVELLVRTNPGEAFGPAHRIASGGERSRIYLGVSVLDADSGDQPLRLFDEIDAGLGMEGAAPVADLLANLAGRSQVLCISHLATVAARGVRHLKISKGQQGKRTVARATYLEGEARVGELTRLLGGVEAEDDTGHQEAFARKLLESAGGTAG